MAKYIFVTGGVSSSLGKGIISASLGTLLIDRGLKVTIQKFDPYINVDPGTMNPYEHGECFVTEDGAETDLDLGHYERFLGIDTSQANNVTTGRIYNTVIQNERAGVYLGKTVQVIPHITDEIKRRMKLLSSSGDGAYDIVITELGGTVGDIESLPYVEAVRQLRWELGHVNCLVVHLTLIPYLSAAKELKTKPTQHSVQLLSQYGLTPDVIVCRTEHTLTDEVKAKISRFCNVESNSVIEAIDASSIYQVPLIMQQEGLDQVVLDKLRISNYSKLKLNRWKRFINKLNNPVGEINIGLVGKYVELQDAYKSILEAFVHAGVANSIKVNVVSIHSEILDDQNIAEEFSGLSGLLVAPGFGDRGVEGKIEAIRYARENKLPFLGICLGMQCAVIEFARNVLGLADAHTTEVEPDTAHPVIYLMEEQKSIVRKGGTMRLGSFDCKLASGTQSHKAYKKKNIVERHRHRYEFNNEYLAQFEAAGMIAAGKNPDADLVEVVEVLDHPWFVGAQFHPEYKSRVLKPHPLFVAFVKAAAKYAESNADNSLLAETTV